MLDAGVCGRGARGVGGRAGPDGGAERRACLRAVSGQISLARMREFGISPDRDLGQHFLIDSNVLDVAGRLLELDPADVVLEVGAGLGVLTDWLAQRVAVVHAVEIDRRLEPALRHTLEGRTNVELTFGDALDLDLAALDPAPTAMVANLPYNVATPLIVTALPVIPRFCVMVQREAADRFFASPGTKAYGAVSVLVQLACERLGVRRISRSVFVPEPNVDSALVAFARRPGVEFGERWEWTVRVVHAAFSHRRKTLQNSLTLAGLGAGAGRDRPDAGRAAAARAVCPARPGARVVKVRAPAKLNLVLRVGPLPRRRLSPPGHALPGDRPVRRARDRAGRPDRGRGVRRHAGHRRPGRARRDPPGAPAQGHPGGRRARRRIVRRGGGAARSGRRPRRQRAVCRRAAAGRRRAVLPQRL